MPLEVSGIDHLYVSVTDLARSVGFYDPVMRLLGFRKGTDPIAGEPHVHYFNPETQYTIRPARTASAATSWSRCWRRTTSSCATTSRTWSG